MNSLLEKKINLLIHLAKVDGHFAESERSLLVSILKDNGFEETYLEEHKQEVIDINGLVEIIDRTEVLFWILKMIYADNQLHPNEIVYGEIVATNLGFRKEVIKHFEKNELSNLHEFSVYISQFKVIKT